MTGKSILVLALCACLAARAEDPTPKALPAIAWKPLFTGVDQSEFTLEKPRKVRAFLLRIDTQAEGIEFLATPGNGDADGETDGLKTSTFLENHHLQAAINAAPFAPVVMREGQPENISGLSISQGKIVSPADKKRGLPVLGITESNKVDIVPSGEKMESLWNAVSGFSIVLQGGTPQPSGEDLHPRTAAGISKDGRYFYWLVVDGRQKRYSGGATTQELGIWLKELGCWEGINLDGGGTSTLVIENEKGKAQILNRPIHAGIPGLERVSASHLGLRAKALKKAPPTEILPKKSD